MNSTEAGAGLDSVARQTCCGRRARGPGPRSQVGALRGSAPNLLRNSGTRPCFAFLCERGTRSFFNFNFNFNFNSRASLPRSLRRIETRGRVRYEELGRVALSTTKNRDAWPRSLRRIGTSCFEYKYEYQCIEYEYDGKPNCATSKLAPAAQKSGGLIEHCCDCSIEMLVTHETGRKKCCLPCRFCRTIPSSPSSASRTFRNLSGFANGPSNALTAAPSS